MFLSEAGDLEDISQEVEYYQIISEVSMCMRTISIVLLAMLICAFVRQNNGNTAFGPGDGTTEQTGSETTFEPRDETTEAVPEEKIIIDKDPELTNLMEDLEMNGTSVDDQTFGNYSFHVKLLRRYKNDCDCCCPTLLYYCHPMPYTENGVSWYPAYGQWSKIGKCLRVNQVCHKKSCEFTYQRCRQLYQWKKFVYFRIYPFFQIKIKYVLLPDYCNCPCGSNSVELVSN